ncbi:MAG: alpha/beta hydrolase [Candidatus Protistobacter heckmanni]|nr:alpha/beta hydrolase [Candidatus Protistobacter heckmanni]
MDGNPTPVLAIVGEHDPSIHAELTRQTWLRWYPNARREVLANAGHYPMMEAPLALYAMIQGFLVGH